ncbi:L-type lectin-domain containing protein [Paludibaculum fermentans]|uniref:L-type lectin-domain containing protein n=1 Tax=Paludibaculum fermentans TaxID=1473598 RepID=UPI003EB8E37B
MPRYCGFSFRDILNMMRWSFLRRGLIILLFLAGAAGLHGQEGPKLQLVGEAEVWQNRIRLTPAIPQMAGAAWFVERQPVAAGFEMLIRFQLTQQGGLGKGADGFAFVLQNNGPEALAGRGSAGGFALGDGRQDRSQPGIPRSIAVFFDTYMNRDGLDPSDNYIAVCTNGPVEKMRWPPNRLGTGTRLKVRLKDGQPHMARIRYKPPVLFVYLDDGEPELRVPVDLSTVVDPQGRAFIGFTASTGEGWENHDILAWKFRPVEPQVSSDITVVSSDITFSPTSCLGGRNLCTPPEAVVEERGPGQYHVVLPAHVEWGASIPNPRNQQYNITGARGNACWDLESGADGCGGPGGNPGSRNDALISPDQPAGALLSKTGSGRIWFTVNGRKGRRFAANQGFYEFDVSLR